MMETETPARPGSIAAFADDLDRNGFVRIPGLLDPQFMDTLLLRAHARLFRESAEARAKVTSTGSLCHLSDSRSEEHTSELPSLMRNSYAVFCLKKKRKIIT